jgi:UPF0755 protein
MPKSFIRWFAVCFLLCVTAIAGAYLYIVQYINTPMPLPAAGINYQLERGGSLASVSRWLSTQGYLSFPRLVTLYSRFEQQGSNVQAGEYFFESGLTPLQLINKLSQGKVKTYQITFVEGWSLRQVLVAIQGEKKLTSTPQLTPESLVPLLAIQSAQLNPEGLFFPDTFTFYGGMTDIELLKQSYQVMEKVLAEEWALRGENLPYKSAYEALIMASVIEKETGDPSEREQISGVFVRRLQKKMRLQTDPTIIYGLGESFDGNLRSKHLKDASNPYNTYRHSGLPPTPIALPGRAAIYAALHPAPGESLYFVAKGNGQHYFSATLAEHQKAVRKYQVFGRRKDYTSRVLKPTAKK